MTLPGLIEITTCNHAKIARAMPMSRSYFNNKLKGNDGLSFSDGEKEQIKLILRVLAESIIEGINELV